MEDEEVKNSSPNNNTSPADDTSPFYRATQKRGQNNFKPTYKGDNNPYKTIGESKTPVHYDTGLGNSIYDEGIRWGIDVEDNNIQSSINNYRADKQGILPTAGAGLGRIVTKVGAEMFKTVGAIAGTAAGIIGNTVDLVTGQDNTDFLETAFNNDFIKATEKLQSIVNEGVLPVYVSDAVANGSFMDKVTSNEFWATDGADGVGYLISAMAPGAVINKLGAAEGIFGGLTKLNSFVRYGDDIEKARIALMKAGVTIDKINDYIIPAANTYFEAGAEAKGVGDDLEKRKNYIIKSFLLRGLSPEQAEAAFQEQKGRAMRNTFFTNIAILAVPNYIQSKLVFGKTEKQVLLDKMLTGSVENPYKKAAIRVGEAFLSEGSEEVAQTSTENRNVKRASNRELGEYAINDLDPLTFGRDFIETLGTTEGQISGFLGGILGSPISVVQGHKQDVKNQKGIERLKSKIDVQASALKDITGTPLYEQEEYINPETNQRDIRDKVDENGDKVFDKAGVLKVKKALDFQENLSKVYDKAVEENDIETIEHLKKLGETNIIMNFIGEDKVTLEALKDHLNTIFPVESETGQNLTLEQKKQNEANKNRISQIVDKALHLQKQLTSFKDMASSIIKLNNEDATKEQKISFLNDIGNAFLSERADEYDLKQKQKELLSEKSRLESELNGTKLPNPNYIEGKTEDIYKEFTPKTSKPLEIVNKKLDEIEKQLEDFNETTNNLIWDNEFLNKQLNNRIKAIKKLENNTTDEVVDKHQTLIDAVKNPNLKTKDELDTLVKNNKDLIDKAPLIQNIIQQKYKEIQDKENALKDATAQAVHDAKVEEQNTNPTDGTTDTTIDNSNTSLDEDTVSIQTNQTAEVGEFDEILVGDPKEIENLESSKSQQPGARVISTYQDSGETIPGLEDFVAYQNEPRDKSKDRVTFSLGDRISEKTQKAFDKVKFGEYTPEDLKQVEDYLHIKVTFSEKNNSNSKSKDDIEKRRKEELNNPKEGLTKKDALIEAQKDLGNLDTKEKRDRNKDRIEALKQFINLLSNSNSIEEAHDKFKDSFTETTPVTNRIAELFNAIFGAKNNINAKYDAELEALENNVSSFIDDMSHPNKDIVQRETLPLRKAIINAVIKNKGSFEGIQGSIIKQFPGVLTMDSPVAKNNIFDLDIFKDMSEAQRITYFQNNTVYTNLKGETLSTKTGEVTEGPQFKKGDPNKHKGEVFLKIPMNNGKPFWLKLNVNTISEDKANALFDLMTIKFRLSEQPSLQELEQYLIDNNQTELLYSLQDEINLIKTNEPLRIDRSVNKLIDLLIHNGNQNVKTKFNIDFEGSQVEVGTLFGKLNDTPDVHTITAQELLANPESYRSQFTNFFNYKRSNVLFSNGKVETNKQSNTAAFKNKNYIKYLVNNNILTTNAVVNEPTFGGYSNIYLNHNVTNNGQVINQVTPIVKEEVKQPVELAGAIDTSEIDKLLQSVEEPDVQEVSNKRESLINEFEKLKTSNPKEYIARLMKITEDSNGRLTNSDITKGAEFVIDKMIDSGLPIEGTTIKKDC